MKFIYKARTREGRLESGVIEAYSKEAAAILLQKYQIYVTSIENQKTAFSLLSMRIERKVSKKELTVFFRQLAVMLQSRVPVVQSLTSLAGQIKKNNFREVVVKVASLVEEGVPLSDAFANYPKIFSTFYVNLIRSGEASGNISGSLEYISQHLERENDISAQLHQAMVYPIFVVAVLGVVMTIIMVAVVPRIVDLVKESGTQPPLFTVLMLHFYSFMNNYWWVVLLGVAALVVFLVLYLKTPKGIDQMNRLFLKIPFLGDMLKKVFLGRFCGNVSTLMSAGISINRALKITQDTVNNSVYRDIIAKIEKDVSSGEKMSFSMAGYPDYFPPFVVQMIKVGEDTGKMDTTLVEVVNFYQKDIKRAIDLFTSLIEPVMIIFLGIVVALLAVSVLAPLYGTLGSI